MNSLVSQVDVTRDFTHQHLMLWQAEKEESREECYRAASRQRLQSSYSKRATGLFPRLAASNEEIETVMHDQDMELVRSVTPSPKKVARRWETLKRLIHWPSSGFNLEKSR